MSELRVDVVEGTLYLTIDRPHKGNSMTMDILDEMKVALDSKATDNTVRSVVVRGNGGHTFCTGVDLSTMQDGASPFQLHTSRRALGDLFRTMWSYPKVIVAAVQGYALAGGFGLMAACDMVIAEEGSQFGAPEVNVGVWPFMISVPLLRYINPRILFELMVTGRRFGTDEARAMGVINRISTKDDFEGDLKGLLGEINSKSLSVVALGKESFYRALDMNSTDALGYLQAMLSVVNTLEDSTEGIAAFAGKRKPMWRDR